MFKPLGLRFSYRSNSTISNARLKLNFENRELFIKSISQNQTLLNLWSTPYKTPETDEVNAPTTVPIILRTKPAVFQSVIDENPGLSGLRLQLKQYTSYTKSVIRFYKVGIQNVWRNRREIGGIKKKYYIESVDKHGRVVKRNFRNGEDLTNLLANLHSLQAIEQETLKTVDKTSILNITRKEYLKVLRTEQDFYKLPLFALITMIFAETTPILCYVFPELAPTTCVFTKLLTKKYSASITASQELAKLRKERYMDYYSKGETPFQSVYTIPHDELRLLLESLNLKSRYIPTALYPISILQSRLKSHMTKVEVDNKFLVNEGREDGNNLWNVSKNELIRSCLERGLLDLAKDDLYKLGAHDLKIRLFFHLGHWGDDKSIGNVGKFCTNNLGIPQTAFFENVDHDTSHKVYGWWQHEHRLEHTK